MDASAQAPEILQERASAASRRICNAVVELNNAIDGAGPDEQMLAVLSTAETLVDIYLKVAALNKQFHICCQRGERPREIFN
jgi:hypothetical protein